MSTEPNLVMVESPDGSVHARPGLGETLKRIETEFFVFVGDDPDNAKVGVNADGIDDAAGILAAMPGASIAIRELYAGAWAVHRPKPEPNLCDRCDEIPGLCGSGEGCLGRGAQT